MHAGARAGAAPLGIADGARPRHYPSQDIRFICAFPPGSGADVLVRYFAEKLRPIAGRTVIVENKAGAGGNIATEYVARAKPDGYTIYRACRRPRSRPISICSRSRRSMSARRSRSPRPSTASPSCWWSMPRAPTRRVADLTAAMKQKGDKATYATAAPTGTHHGRDLQGRDRHQGGRGELQDRAGLAQRDARAASSTTACTIRCSRWRSSAKAGCASSAVSTGKRLEANPEHADHDGIGRSHGPHRLVGGDGADRHAASRSSTRSTSGSSQIVSTEETKKFLNSFGGDPFINTPEAAQALLPQGDQGLGRLRRAGQDRAAMTCRRARRHAGGSRVNIATFVMSRCGAAQCSYGREAARSSPPWRWPLAPQAAQAQDYPSQDIRFICGFPAGSGADVLVRYFGREGARTSPAAPSSSRTRSGAAGNIAAEYIARAKPDGHTVYVHAASAIAANMHLFKKPPIDAGKRPADRRRHQQAAVHGHGCRQQPLQDARRADRRDEEEGRQGELRPVQHQRQGDGRALQAGDRRHRRRGRLPDRERQP